MYFISRTVQFSSLCLSKTHSFTVGLSSHGKPFSGHWIAKNPSCQKVVYYRGDGVVYGSVSQPFLSQDTV